MYILIFLLVLLIASPVLQLTGRRQLGCWMLVVFPAMVCGAGAINLVRGGAALGQGAYSTNEQQVAYSIVLLAISVIAGMRPQWRWLYWSAWVFNALACSVLVYLVFFWKVLS